MSQPSKKADVVIVGFGWAGSLMAAELAEAGLDVVAIERGQWRDTATDFAPGVMMDELRFVSRREIMQPLAVETLTFRNSLAQTALPLRDWNTYQFGWGVGGAGSHWNGMTWRYQPNDFQTYSNTIKRYGAARIPESMTLQDWGVTYDDLEPFYDKFERIAGTSGKAGNIRGEIIKGGNPFEGPRQRDYPLPPLAKSRVSAIFEKATLEMGLHPFPTPAGNTSGAYTNHYGVRMGPCTYCGYCEFFGCGNWSKSSPQACVLPALMVRPNFRVITDTEVLKVNLDSTRTKATGVTCIGADGKEWVQEADLVIISAYQMDNVRLLLLSGIGQPYDPKAGTGVVGRNYVYQTIASAQLFLPKTERLNPFIGAGALGESIDDFNSDNFDHSKLDFIGGANAVVHSTHGRPIALGNVVPPGTPTWGSAWKQAYKDSYQIANSIYCQGNSHPDRGAFLDLDPTYTDRHGRPLLRVTFDWNDNDRKLGNYMADRAVEIAKAMGSETVVSQPPKAHYAPMENLSSHTAGGAVMGDDPRTSVVNRYLQSWDVSNVFVAGASAFPNNGGYNPTGTVAATTLWAAHAILTQYLKSPGPLMKV